MSEKIKRNIEDAELHFFREADPGTIRNSLQDCIPDLQEYARKKNKALTTIKFLVKANSNKQRDGKLLEIAAGFREAIDKNIDKPLQFLRSLMSSKISVTYNNNLEKLSQEEIIELIKDQNLVNLLEQLDKDGTDIKGKV